MVAKGKAQKQHDKVLHKCSEYCGEIRLGKINNSLSGIYALYVVQNICIYHEFNKIGHFVVLNSSITYLIHLFKSKKEKSIGKRIINEHGKIYFFFFWWEIFNILANLLKGNFTKLFS